MVIGNKIYRTGICSDSMEWAKQNIKDAPDGAVFLADELTNAKGRSGRIWKFYKGQLAVTVLLKPKILAELSVEDLPIRINQLNMSISCAIYDVLKEFGVGIKWPNDFVINNKKVGGILFQLVWEKHIPVAVIFGFAINVNNVFNQSDDLFSIATSIKSSTNFDIEMRPLYKNLIKSINLYYVKWRNGMFNEIYKDWRNAQRYLGMPIFVHSKNGSVLSGRMNQVFPSGDMLLSSEDGSQKMISFFMIDEVLFNI